MDYTQILIRPLISEKGTFLKEEQNQVAFFVRKDANKVQIKEAVEKAFEVSVEAVNVVVKKAQVKLVTRGRKRQQSRIAGYKKAYVTLAPGSKIEFFEGV
ncbi:50S ribosomal protein L23 [Desulfovibrio sp. OttesenSCG-928-M14]|nr:50S ribosomal protein L23 [Desulfovibrio sp. OttesenSCG-928-M16]MDL2216175.1 50S ribosomal protein L23 [Desulfovibrio sp. OttesenSCG-928-M14]MDL2290943.1 50S ribosomal protein L23 [Desulfovibrio sp. OttesenSCG-928-F20]